MLDSQKDYIRFIKEHDFVVTMGWKMFYWRLSAGTGRKQLQRGVRWKYVFR